LNQGKTPGYYFPRSSQERLSPCAIFPHLSRLSFCIHYFRYPVWEDSHRSISDRNDFTDDTDQLLLMLQSLEQTADGTLHALNFAKKMAEWNDFGFPELGTPARGIGYTVGQVLDNQEFRTNPHKAAFDVRVCFLSVLVYVSWTL
jgi:hypothetical protein